MRERKRLESMLSLEGDLARRTDDIATYFDLAGEGENVAADLQRDLDSLRELVDRVETETLLSGPTDGLNAIVTIHPGAGGTESQDWAEMLLRMYLRWAERLGFKTEMYDYQARRRSGNQVGDIFGDRPVCIRLFDKREIETGCQRISLRSGEARRAYLARQRLCFS